MRAPLTLIAPNLVLFALFFAWPAAIGIAYSFTNYNGFSAASFVGLSNYTQLLGDPLFHSALVRTLLFTGMVVPLAYVLSLTIAMLLVSRYAKGKLVARVFFFIPWLISPIVNGLIWRWMFGENFGLVNFALQRLGLPTLAWQSNGTLSLIVMVMAEAWAGTAFSMLLFVAALKNVPQVYYEAAAIDGAPGWRRFWHITLPGIRWTSFIVVLLTTIGTMKEYALIIAFGNGGPGTENNLMVKYIYQTGFQETRIGYGSAASLVLMLLLMAVAMLQILVNRRREKA